MNESYEAEEEMKLSRHYVYTKHFPLNHEDASSLHDCNQRYILLFGVGKERDEKKHAVKKMAKGENPSAVTVLFLYVRIRSFNRN